jgi:hypothetical protein
MNQVILSVCGETFRISSESEIRVEAVRPSGEQQDPSIGRKAEANTEHDDVDRSALRASSAVKVGATNSPDGATKQRVHVNPQHEADQAATSSAVGQATVRNAGVTAGRVPATVSKKPSKQLRPYCKRPELCGGYGRNHCGTCEKSKEQIEVAA